MFLRASRESFLGLDNEDPRCLHALPFLIGTHLHTDHGFGETPYDDLTWSTRGAWGGTAPMDCVPTTRRQKCALTYSYGPFVTKRTCPAQTQSTR